jgi:8-oxo-dGTP diphosphatase
MDKIFYDDLISKANVEGINRYVVGAVIVNDSRILLLQRPINDFMGGIYELPSGEVEEGESLDVALLREVEEETGMNISKISQYIGHFDYESKSGKKTRQFNFAVNVSPFLEIKLTEHDSYIWSKREELYKYQVTDSVKNVLDVYWSCYVT